MVRETAKAAAARGNRKLGILATDGTIQTGVYQRELSALGLESFSPPPEIQRLVMSIIYDEIKKGEKGSREKFSAIDKCLRAAGCDGAILGCTELSVYRTYHGLPQFYIDAMDVLEQQFASGSNTVQRPRVLSVSSGFSYRYDLSQPAGARISHMVLNGAPVTDTQSVRVVMSSFLDSGGDNFTVLTQGQDRRVGELDLDALEAYFRLQSPVAPPATHRITRVAPAAR